MVFLSVLLFLFGKGGRVLIPWPALGLLLVPAGSLGAVSPVRGPVAFSEDGTLFVDEGCSPPHPSPQCSMALSSARFGGEDKGLYGQGFPPPPCSVDLHSCMALFFWNVL